MKRDGHMLCAVVVVDAWSSVSGMRYNCAQTRSGFLHVLGVLVGYIEIDTVECYFYLFLFMAEIE